MKSLFCLLYAFYLCSSVEADDVLGCNGFVKSEIDINFSEVEVKLFTKQGSLKDFTECAPNNGYYFLPLYDRGEYVLKVTSPLGWTFEPSEVPLTIDGVSDPCSQGKDINFHFKGFAVIGKVVSRGKDIGPKGVKVSLHNDAHPNKAIKEVMTGDEGLFVFTPVLPGHYTVVTSHPKWKFTKDKVSVEVVNGNGKVKGLTVAGYDVTGSVTSDGQPIAGVRFVLFTEMPPPLDVEGCEMGRLEGFSVAGALGSPVCHVASAKTGKFVFPLLPPGPYTLIPYYYTATATKFHVHPRTLKFTLGHSSLNLTSPFQVKGFTVSGKILWSSGGRPMEGATVTLDGKQIAKTGPDGVYHLESMKAGTYKLQVEADGVEFAVNEVKVSATTLEDSFPIRYKVCGALTPSLTGISVIAKVDKEEGAQVSSAITADGKYCFMLPKGKYSVQVDLPQDLWNSGLQFTPLRRQVEVVDRVVGNINFSQLKCSVRGKIVCKTICPLITVNLKPRGTGNTLQTIAKGGVYEFKDISPGEYDVFIEPGLEWCWDREIQNITVNNEETQVPVFTQSGRTVTIISSHYTKVVYWSEDGSGEKGEVKVSPGKSHICVSSSGPLLLEPVGCSSYSNTPIKWESGTIKLQPVSHSNNFTIKSTHAVDDLVVNVISRDIGTQLFKLRPIQTTIRMDGSVLYEISVQLKPGQKVTYIPSASHLLFTPVSKDYESVDQCSWSLGAWFTAEKGLVLKGRVTAGDDKGLGDVIISVVDQFDAVVVTQQTQSDGSYRFPPIRMSPNYRLTAVKEGYVLTKSQSTPGDFSAHKLAEINVTVTDKSQPLQGVLLSLSGGENYRRNAQTNASGTMSFLSLSPGEYFLRAMMKEYSFTPTSKIISVQEGATINVALSGERVAWSGLGRVVSLNGEGESGVTVEAVGQENCSLLQEEAASGPTGAFRIRGLQPNCEYKVRVKEGPEINSHIQKSTPESIPVKVVDSDISGLILYALRGISRTDIVVYVRFSEDEELRGAKLKLVREDNMDSPLVVVKLSDYAPRSVNYHLTKGVVVALGGVVADGRNYIVSAGGGSRPVVVKAEGPLKLARLTLAPSATHQPPHPDLSRPVYPPALPLAILGVLIYYYRKKLMALLPDLHLGVNTSEDSEDNSMKMNKRTKSRKT